MRLRDRRLGRHLTRSYGRPLPLAGALISCAALVAGLTAASPRAAGQTTTTYTATETIPVPPASAYAGSGGGDGWAIALSSNDVYNVFHHSDVLQVACHLQSDASACWSPETITDTSGDNFATSGQPGLWLNQTTGKLYVYATRTSDSTGGVVCIDTTVAATNPNPFCGFTILSNPGEASLASGISNISDPVLVGNDWYAFNYSNTTVPNGSQDELLCFDTTTLSACPSQPFAVSVGSGPVSDGSFPAPSIAAIGGLILVPIIIGSIPTQTLGCFDPATSASCTGSWPVALPFNYVGSDGSPFPLLSSTGATIGLCLPTGTDQCFDLAGASIPTPSGMPNAIPANDPWNGPAFVIGPRAYIANGNTNEVHCFDASTNATCASFPLSFNNMYYLYTVNPDPQRPTCIWVNADSGSAQIQNFDAYTAGGCGQGPIRVLASSLVVPTQLCVPTSYTSLQVVQPPPGSYTTGTVAFEDNDGNPIPGTSTEPLDATGTADLTGFNLNTALGLPQFLITLNGTSSTPTSVEVQLTWTGADDPSCVPSTSSPTNLPVTESALPQGEPSIAGSFTNPGTLVVTETSGTGSGQLIDGARFVGVAMANVSTDSGSHWTATPLPPSSAAISCAASHPKASNIIGDSWVVASHKYGDFYATYLAGCNSDASADLLFSASADGSSWQVPVTIDPGIQRHKFDDRPMITVDNSPQSPTYGRIYIVWVADDSGSAQGLGMAWSDDRGMTWTHPSTVRTSPSCSSTATGDVCKIWTPYVTVDGNGNVAVAWYDFFTDDVYVQRMPLLLPGGSGRIQVQGQPVSVGSTGFGHNSHLRIASAPDNGINPLPIVLADDDPASPFYGRYYVIFTRVAGASAATDVVAARSADSGVTWTSPKRVNDDYENLVFEGCNCNYDGISAGNAPSANDFLPSAVVEPGSGRLDIGFYSTRLDPGPWCPANNCPEPNPPPAPGGWTQQPWPQGCDCHPDVYTTSSTDGGVSFTPNARVTTSPSDLSTDNPARCTACFDYGDYEGMTFQNGAARLAWTDARSSDFSSWGNAEVFVGSVK